ncbi:MAG: M3 family metallopeptidase [Deferrisomatales bacterium]|nr:M3 family metallopeptidase [Deferrisomatales bacterium]
MTANPLLTWTDAPPFDRIRTEHVVPAVRQLLAKAEAQLAALEADPGIGCWDCLVPALERLEDQLWRVWGVVEHLLAVRNSPELREAHGAVEPEVVRFGNRHGQSQELYRAFRALREDPGWDALPRGRQRLVEARLLGAELSGVALAGAEKERFNRISERLAELSTEFAHHVLDATQGFRLELTERSQVEGLPQSLLELAAASARTAGRSPASAAAGPWHITLDLPCYLPFQQYSRRRPLREALYRAYVGRASGGADDNLPLIDEILRLRRERAGLLGYPHPAAVSLATKMAPDTVAVERLLGELEAVALPAARREHAELVAFAHAQGAPEAASLTHWDVPFWAERLREQRYALDEEQLRPFFPLPRVLDGLFGQATELFGITVSAADGEVPVWHPDVRFFRVADPGGEPLAAFYLDPYARPSEKRPGAWMGSLVGRSTTLAAGGDTHRRPAAYLVCNASPPAEGRPALLTFSEVRTLFHEFGHALQHMLTTEPEGLVAGIRNVEWDAVELVSQFLENWCYHEQTLAALAHHFQTGRGLPTEQREALQQARVFREGTATLRQLGLAWFDWELHRGFDPAAGDDPVAVQQRVLARTGVLPPLEENRFLCSFSHIFAGGYAAGYYSYKWAEVLSADAFAAFEETGFDQAQVRELGRRFRDTVLARGGGEDPGAVFRAFRGRDPSPEALLRQGGLID